MRKYLFTLGLCVWMGNLLACDVCGFYLGVRPDDYQHSFGILYRSRMMGGTLYPTTKALPTKHAAHLIEQDLTGKEVKELYNVMELRGRYQLSQRIQLLGVLPFVNNYRSFDNGTTADVYGMGDPVLLCNYQLYNTVGSENESENRVVHRLVVGGGLKAPLGQQQLQYNGAVVDADLQGSTGSWDFLGRLEYLFRVGKTGISYNAIAKYNTTDPTSEYRFGNTLGQRLDAFAVLPWKNFNLMPATGAYLEWAGTDQNQTVVEQETGGSALFWTAGLRVYYKQFAFQSAYQLPVSQQLNGQQLSNINRFIVGLSYNIQP